MSIKAFILSAVLAGGALAAPTSSAKPDLERRADWRGQTTDIGPDSNGWALDKDTTAKWELSINDKESHQMAGWAGTNPADINIATTKGHNFVIQGFPSGYLSSGTDGYDALTLSYDTQKWNSKDCYKYVLKTARPSNGWRHQFDWYCQFDC